MNYHLHLSPMKNTSLSLLLAAIVCLVGCKNNDKDVASVEVAKAYYKSLNSSNLKKLSSLLTDSIICKELDYEASFSKDGYKELQRWDSVFQPTYKILEIQEVDGEVKSKISKACLRTLFLNGEPVVTKETISFKNGKIKRVSIDKYVVFNWKRWDSVRSRLVNYIDENQPELNGFLYNQTVEGALNYTEAVQLFNKSKESEE
nr:hypothetical protein [uncultured Allomuricauda sp.]